MKSTLIIISIFLSSLSTFAGGFDIPLQSIKIAGFGNAGSAFIEDASSLYFNPASISFLDQKFNVTVGSQALLPYFLYRNDAQNITQYNKGSLVPLPHIYLSYKLNDKFSLGFSTNVNFGSSVDFGNEWYNNTVVTKMTLLAFYGTLHGSYKITKNFSVGASAGLGFITAHLQRVFKEIPVEFNKNNPPTLTLSGNGFGYMLGAGLFFQSNDKTINASVAFKYFSNVKASNAQASLNNIDTSFQSSIPHGKASTELYFPYEINFGIMKKIKKITIGLTGVISDWTSFKTLTINFEDAPFKGTPNGKAYYDMNLNWSYQVGLGVGYELKKFKLRCGVSFNKSAANKNYLTPILPLDDIITYTSGVSYYLSKKIDIDVNYLVSQGLSIKGGHDKLGLETATYKSLTNIFGVGISYHL